MSGERLGVVAGIIFSLTFSYIPGVKEWFEPLKNKYKQGIMGALLVLVAGAWFGLSCAGVVEGPACNQEGALEAVSVLFFALIANQGTYLMTKPDKPA